MARRLVTHGRDILAVWVVMGLVCVSASAFYLWRVHGTRSTITWLNSLEARVFWDHDSRASDPAALRSIQRLVASAFGPEYLSVITTAEIDRPEADDGQLSRLSSLRRLEILRLNSHECSDATIARVSELSRLRELSITADQVSFQGLLELRKLTHLKSLRLASMSLTKGELAVLAAALPWVDLNYNEHLRQERFVRKVAERFPRVVRDNIKDELRFESLFKQEEQGNVKLRPMAYRDTAHDHQEMTDIENS